MSYQRPPRPSARPAPHPAPPPCVVRLGDGVWLPPGGNTPLALEGSEDAILLAFFRLRAMSLPVLVDQSGVEHAAKVLARLAVKYGGAFAAAIRRPGRRGNGGYAVAVRNDGPPIPSVQKRPTMRPVTSAGGNAQ